MSSAIDEGFRLSFWLKKNVTSQKIEGGASIRAGAFIRRNTVHVYAFSKLALILFKNIYTKMIYFTIKMIKYAI